MGENTSLLENYIGKPYFSNYVLAFPSITRNQWSFQDRNLLSPVLGRADLDPVWWWCEYHSIFRRGGEEHITRGNSLGSWLEAKRKAEMRVGWKGRRQGKRVLSSADGLCSAPRGATHRVLSPKWLCTFLKKLSRFILREGLKYSRNQWSLIFHRRLDICFQEKNARVLVCFCFGFSLYILQKYVHCIFEVSVFALHKKKMTPETEQSKQTRSEC